MPVMTDVRRPLHRIGRTLVLVFAIFFAAAVINFVGIWLIGDVSSWIRWLQEHSGHFVVWRGFLYAATGFGWWWMRKRVLHREPHPQTRARLLRAEIAAVLAISALEVTTFLQMR